MSEPLAGVVLDAIKSVYEANKPAIEAEISTLEGGAVTIATNLVNNIKPGGVLGMIWPSIKAAVITELTSLIQTQGAPAIYALIDSELAAWAKAAGG